MLRWNDAAPGPYPAMTGRPVAIATERACSAASNGCRSGIRVTPSPAATRNPAPAAWVNC